MSVPEICSNFEVPPGGVRRFILFKYFQIFMENTNEKYTDRWVTGHTQKFAGTF